LIGFSHLALCFQKNYGIKFDDLIKNTKFFLLTQKCVFNLGNYEKKLFIIQKFQFLQIEKEQVLDE